jgi:hypothetical protein
MNAGIGPAYLPTIQIGLCLLQALETFSLERSLGVSHAGFDFSFSIWIFAPTGEGYGAIVRQYVAIRADSEWDRRCQERAHSRASYPGFVAGRVMWPRLARSHAGWGLWRNMRAHNKSVSSHHGLPFGTSERRLLCSNAIS